MKLRPFAFVLLVAACDSSPEPKEDQDPPLVEGKADRYATDFVLAGELAPGGTLQGELSDVNRFLGYTFYGRAGDSVTVSIGDAAAGLDTVLWVYGPYDPDRGRWSAKPIAVNDDRAGSELSTIDTTLGADGMYLAIVTSYQQRTRGAFDLRFACGGCSTQPRAGDLVVSEVHARATADANGDQLIDDADRFVEIRNAARVPIAVTGVDIVGAAVHHIASPGVLGPGQAFVAMGLLLDDGGLLALQLGTAAIDSVTLPTSSLDGSLVRVDDGTTVTFQPHLELTQGARAISPGMMLDGSPFPNPNTSTQFDVSDGADAVEDARLDAQAAVAAKFGKSIPITLSTLVFFGPALDNKDIEAGLRRFIAALPQLKAPDPAITRIQFKAGDTSRIGTSAYLDVHDDGRQAFRVLSSSPATETALAQFRTDAAAAFAAELPLTARIEPRLLAWLPTPSVHPGAYLSSAGVSVTAFKFETRTSTNDYRSDTVTIDLSSTYPSKIRVYIYYAKSSSTVVSSYSLSYSQAGLPFMQDTVRSLGLDGARKQKYAQNYKHTSAGKLLRRTFLDEDGNVERIVDINPPMKARAQLAVDTSEDLDPIYAGLVQRSPSHGRTIVGILDSGIDYNHPALVHKLHENIADGEATDAIDSDGNGRVDDFLGWDFDDDDRLAFDYNDFLLNFSQSFDHGTHVGGIASQGTEDIRLLPVRWKVSGPALVAAVDYMAARGARVVNMSFSSTSTSTMNPLGAAIVARPNLLFVAAAGNDGEDLEVKVRYPASFTAENLIVVAAVDDKGALTSWSNWGAVSCDLAAPGDAIFNTVVGGGWGTKSGTSMSTPYVVNVAAKMLALAPALTPKQLKSILMATVDVRADFAGKMVTQGVVNAARAMRVAWLWQRTRDGEVATTAVAALGLASAEAARLVAIAKTL